ncbi:MAG: alpha/beta hydrolase [Acidobacteriota bacterium]
MAHHVVATRSMRRRMRWSRPTVLTLLVLASMAWLTPTLAAAQPAEGVQKDGSINGLKASFTDVGGIKTRYYEMGSGEPLVLLHGEGWSGHSSANVWSKNIAGLAKHFHVLAVDRLGSGMTDNPKEDKDYNALGEVEHIYQFVNVMKLGKIHLVGHSAGGAVAFYFAAAHPELVKTLVIVGSGPETPDAGPRRLDALLKSCPKEPEAEAWKCRIKALAWLPDVAFNDEYWRAALYMAGLPKSLTTVAKIKAGAGEPMRGKAFQDWLKALWERVRTEGPLQMPILMYWGKNDSQDWLAADQTSKHQRGVSFYDILGEKNPRVKWTVHNKAGHFMYREYPDEFNYDIASFINYWKGQPTAAK